MSLKNEYWAACRTFNARLLKGATAREVLTAGRAVLTTGIRLMIEEGGVPNRGLIAPHETPEDLQRELTHIEDLLLARSDPAPTNHN